MSPDPDGLPTTDSGAAGPLSPAQRHELARANERAAGILRSARVAAFTGWTVGIFGVLSLLFGLVGGASGLVTGAALVAVAWNELRGRTLLRELDPGGGAVLGWNQLLLLAVVAAYCLWAIWQARVHPGESVRQLEEVAGLPEHYVADLTTALYGAVLVVVALVQALLARYHFRHGRELRSYVEETPAWIVELQRSARLER